MFTVAKKQAVFLFAGPGQGPLNGFLCGIQPEIYPLSGAFHENETQNIFQSGLDHAVNIPVDCPVPVAGGGGYVIKNTVYFFLFFVVFFQQWYTFISFLFPSVP